MQNMYYIGLHVDKRTISYCVKHGSGMNSRPRCDSRHTLGPGPLDENIAAAVDGSDGGHGVNRVA
jgi:hypothetical protein